MLLTGKMLAQHKEDPGLDPPPQQKNYFWTDIKN